MDEYELYEAECEKIRTENHKILNDFRKHLGLSKLSKKTIDKHVSNIDFYINVFLLHEEPLRPKSGVNSLDYFLGSWFIRKAMWASVSSIKEYITSLKKFYTFMEEIAEIDSDELLDMKEEIKECKDEWFEAIRKYDDPSTSMEDIW